MRFPSGRPCLPSRHGRPGRAPHLRAGVGRTRATRHSTSRTQLLPRRRILDPRPGRRRPCRRAGAAAGGRRRAASRRRHEPRSAAGNPARARAAPRIRRARARPRAVAERGRGAGGAAEDACAGDLPRAAHARGKEAACRRVGSARDRRIGRLRRQGPGRHPRLGARGGARARDRERCPSGDRRIDVPRGSARAAPDSGWRTRGGICGRVARDQRAGSVAAGVSRQVRRSRRRTFVPDWCRTDGELAPRRGAGARQRPFHRADPERRAVALRVRRVRADLAERGTFAQHAGSHGCRPADAGARPGAGPRDPRARADGAPGRARRSRCPRIRSSAAGGRCAAPRSLGNLRTGAGQAVFHRTDGGRVRRALPRARRAIVIPILHLRQGSALYGADRAVLALCASTPRPYLPIVGAIGRPGVRDALAEEARRRGIAAVQFDSASRFDLRCARAIARVARERGVRLLHAHDFKALFVALVAGLLARVPVVATFHGDTRTTAAVRVYEMVARILGNFTRGVAAVSRALERRLRRWVRIAPVAFVPNGLPQSAPVSEAERRAARAKFAVRPDAYCIALIGRLAPEKGHRILFDSARATDATLLVAGDGPLRDELREAAQRLDVRFLGYLEEAREVFAAADVIAIPSLTEGLPLTALEAMAAGRCVVASAVGELPELLSGGAGVLVPAGDAAALSDALAALRLPAAREKVEQSALERARGYGVAAMARAYASLYGRALAGSRSSR